jgi:hypothetical protein
MATTKTFQTLFNIAAKFTGKPAFAQANRALRLSTFGVAARKHRVDVSF